MNIVMFSFILLGFTLLMHLVFVNVIIGAAALTVAMRYVAYRRGDAGLELLARKAFRILVVSDLFGGVWATILTVLMAGLYPSMTAIFMHDYFYPVAIAITGIMVSIPLIAVYWHLWGRMNPRLHSLLGLLLLASILLVPIGFRYFFAGMTYADPSSALANPVYPPLIIHTLIGAVDIGAFVTAAVLASRSNLDVRGVRISLGTGLAMLPAQAAAGGYYYAVLVKYSPYVAGNVGGPLLGYADGNPMVYPAFYSGVALAAVLGAVAAYAFYASLRGEVRRWAVIMSGVLSEAVMLLMEYANDMARYPYIFVQGSGGATASSLLDSLMPIPLSAIYIMLASSIFFVGVFSAAFYYAILRRFIPETE